MKMNEIQLLSVLMSADLYSCSASFMSTYWLWNSACKGQLDNSLDSWKQEIKYQKILILLKIFNIKYCKIIFKRAYLQLFYFI